MPFFQVVVLSKVIVLLNEASGVVKVVVILMGFLVVGVDGIMVRCHFQCH